jgi:hypothetical protein
MNATDRTNLRDKVRIAYSAVEMPQEKCGTGRVSNLVLRRRAIEQFAGR